MTTSFYTRFKPAPSIAQKFKEPSLVQPQFKHECDINKNVKMTRDSEGNARTVVSVLPSSLPPRASKPVYGDFTKYTPEKLMEAKNFILEAERQFNELPATIRERFANSPHKLVEFLSNDSNYDEAVKLGLANKREPVKDVATPSQVVPPMATTPSKVTSAQEAT